MTTKKTTALKIKKKMTFTDKDLRCGVRTVTVLEKDPKNLGKWICVNGGTGRKTSISEKTLRTRFRLDQEPSV